ncbi:MAG: hypothetical protein EHM48_10625 [Planctomycetaceae bacterium]|nr:MAG: hypothetical protein EHM48_10625 [Planctomycetaceae bacterium]
MEQKRISFVLMTGMLAACAFVAGCFDLDERPTVKPGTLWEPTKALHVSQNDPTIYQGALRAENARINYMYRLEVLKGYYDKIGDADKYHWASLELANVNKAQWFKWEGIGNATPAPGENVDNASEAYLAELVVISRNEWIAAMKDMAGLYEQRGMTEPAKTCRTALARLRPEHLYTYMVSAEVPGPDLRPTRVVPEAEALYGKAYKLFREGKGLLPPLTDYKKEREAQEMFKQLIREYPDSSRIALAAYYIADIYKEYFNKDVMAVKWYERAWQWSENKLTEPAYFQAATIYDLRLHNKEKAVECYRNALKYDPPRLGNFDYARNRIKDLTGKEE